MQGVATTPLFAGLRCGAVAGADPPCDIPSSYCSLMGPWTVTCSSMYACMHVASGCCFLSAAAAGALAGVVSAFAEPSSWCVGAVLNVAWCAVCASAAPNNWCIEDVLVVAGSLMFLLSTRFCPQAIHRLPRCVSLCVRPRCPVPPRAVPAVHNMSFSPSRLVYLMGSCSCCANSPSGLRETPPPTRTLCLELGMGLQRTPPTLNPLERGIQFRGRWRAENQKIHWGIVLLGKNLILQGVPHPISCRGVCYVNNPPKKGCTWGRDLLSDGGGGDFKTQTPTIWGNPGTQKCHTLAGGGGGGTAKDPPTQAAKAGHKTRALHQISEIFEAR